MENKYGYKETDYVHCKFCDWKSLKYYHKNGRIISGNKRLLQHTSFVHMEELEEIRKGNKYD